jgi:hypothetical protein
MLDMVANGLSAISLWWCRNARKTFSNGLGLHLQWGDKRRYENYADADDEVLLFNLSWQFGLPPRD